MMFGSILRNSANGVFLEAAHVSQKKSVETTTMKLMNV